MGGMGVVVVARPRVVAVSACLLVVSGLVAAIMGLLLSWVSNCCGSPDPPDGTPALVGLVAGASLGAAGVLLWRATASRATVLGLAAVGPVVCGVAAVGSVDFQALLPCAVVAWGGLWLVLRRPAGRGWLVK
jgi:hypothetical protein